MIIVVRYFGGTLLGIPGLINAYKTSASLVLQVTPVVQKAVMVNYRIECDYTIINEVMTIIKQFGCLVLDQELQLFCQLRIGIPLNRREEVLFKLTDLRGISVHPL
jgi:putative IMPACT (imprinted ancient) family translation regulator